MTVICDALTVTTPPGSGLVASLDAFLDCIRGERRDLKGNAREFRLDNGGIVHITEGSRWDRVAASGRFLAAVRSQGLFLDYLGLLAESPHTVTRLDAAYDEDRDAAPIIRKLDRKYMPTGYAFTRKAVEVTTLMQTRLDGARTGSVYFGTTDSQVSLRVYDKQHEAMKKRGEVLPPRIRYELEVHREVGATLRDAENPAPLFYHFMSPEFLKRPSGVPEWAPNGEGWVTPSYEPRLPAERLEYAVDASQDLLRWIELADQCGSEGRTYLLGLLRRRLTPQVSH